MLKQILLKKHCMLCVAFVFSSVALWFNLEPATYCFAAHKAVSTRSPQQETEQQKDLIFTRAQALRGEAVYDTQCASCHGSKLEGTPASALTGERFVSKWGDGKHTVDDLYYITRTQMPYGAAGKLSKQQYIDVVAFMLNKNGYPPGDQELPADPAVLEKLIIKPNDLSQEKTANKGERE